eukprot:GEMP01025515.1.p1 GENE.GEMP01025515.1~~GEMP01025515.1.p1  ORF type:complete len:396 (+),score=91.44 GEMP01025515.1:55-1242(+)
MPDDPYNFLGIREFSSPKTIHKAVEQKLDGYRLLVEEQRRQALNATKDHNDAKERMDKRARIAKQFAPQPKHTSTATTASKTVKVKRSLSSSSSSSNSSGSTADELEEAFQRPKNAMGAGPKSNFEFDKRPREEFFENPHVTRTESSFNAKRFRAATGNNDLDFTKVDKDEDECPGFDREKFQKAKSAVKTMNDKLQIRDMKRLCNLTHQLVALRAVLDGKLAPPLVMFRCWETNKADSFVADSDGVYFTRHMARENQHVSNRHFRASASSHSGVLVADNSTNGTFYITSSSSTRLQVPTVGVHIPLAEKPKIIAAEIEFSVEPVLADIANVHKAAEGLFKALKEGKAPVTVEGIRYSGIGREIRKWANGSTEFSAIARELLNKYMELVSIADKK